MAQGIALSTASGNMQPTRTARGRSACIQGSRGSAAITAATLAREGFTGPKQVYEGRFGLFPCFLGEYAKDADLDAVTESLGSRWECPRTSIKLYPACHQSHAR